MDTNNLNGPEVHGQELPQQQQQQQAEQQADINSTQSTTMSAFPFATSSGVQELPSNFSVTPHITTPEDGQPLLHQNMLALMGQSSTNTEPLSNGHEQSQAPKVRLQIQQLRTDALTIEFKQQQPPQQQSSLVMSSVASSAQQQQSSQLELLNSGQPQVDMSGVPTPALSQNVINSTTHIELGQQPIAIMTPGSHLPLQQPVSGIQPESAPMNMQNQSTPGAPLPSTGGQFMVNAQQSNSSMRSENDHIQPGGADMALINGILEQDQVLEVTSNEPTPLPSPHEVQQIQHTAPFRASSNPVPPYPGHQQSPQSHPQGQVQTEHVQIEKQKLQDQNQMGLHHQQLQDQNQLQLQQEQMINNMLQHVQQQAEQNSASPSPTSGHPDAQAQHQINRENLLQDAMAAHAQRLMAAQHMALAQQQQLHSGAEQATQSAVAVAAAAAVQQTVMHQMASHIRTTNAQAPAAILENAATVTQAGPKILPIRGFLGKRQMAANSAHLSSINESVASQVQSSLQMGYTGMETDHHGTKRSLDEMDQPISRKKARRHTMSSPLPSHVSIPARTQSQDSNMPVSAAILDGCRFDFEGQQQQQQHTGFPTMLGPASALSTPSYTESPVTPSMFSDDQKVMMLKRLAKEQQRQSLGTLTLPPRPTPAELGLQTEDNISIPPKAQAEDAAPSSYDNMSREQLIARLVKLENEKRAQENPDGAASVKEQTEVTKNECPIEPVEEEKPECQEQSKQKQEAEGEPEEIEKDPEEEPKAKNEEAKEEMTRCLWKNCGRSFNTLQELIEHIQDTHVGSGKPTYRCEWEGCQRNQKPFTKRHKMYNHLRTHTGERPYVCPKPGCQKKFSRPDSLTTHIKTHSNVRPYVCQVEGCYKAYYHARSLKKHERVHETHNTEAMNVSFTTATTYSIPGSMPVNFNINVPNTPLHPLSISPPAPSSPQMQHQFPHHPPHHQPPPPHHSQQPPLTPHPSEHTFRPLQQHPLPMAVPMTQSDPHFSYTPSVPSTASQ